MADKDSAKSKGGGGKLSRSETVTVRLDPKLRYLAELAALKQRRTLSSFIEWAIEDTLSRVILQEDQNYQASVADRAGDLWDVDEADRFVKLALSYPDLLVHEQQKLWKLIRENGALWKGAYDQYDEWVWRCDKESIAWDRLREHWTIFCDVARGEADPKLLPQWQKVMP